MPLMEGGSGISNAYSSGVNHVGVHTGVDESLEDGGGGIGNACSGGVNHVGELTGDGSGIELGYLYCADF